MDDLDRAQDHMEREEAMRRKYQEQRKPEVEATGYCLHCGVEVGVVARWCDAICRDGWEDDQKRKRRTG